MSKHLYRSKTNKLIGGVCGGLSEYLTLDPTLIRLLWVLLTISGGIGIIAYIVCMLVIPEEPGYGHDSVNQERKTISLSKEKTSTKDNPEGSSDRNKYLVGFTLVYLGLYLLLKRYFPWFHHHSLWPLLLIAGGIIILYKGRGVK